MTTVHIVLVLNSNETVVLSEAALWYFKIQWILSNYLPNEEYCNLVSFFTTSQEWGVYLCQYKSFYHLLRIIKSLFVFACNQIPSEQYMWHFCLMQTFLGAQRNKTITLSSLAKSLIGETFKTSG